MLGRKKLAGGLWARARREGAVTEIERRNFGIADDVYAAGLLVAYMTFVPFCEPGSIDGPSLQVSGRRSLLLWLRDGPQFGGSWGMTARRKRHEM